MNTLSDSDRFKNHEKMKLELATEGIEFRGNESEAELIHLYNIVFLAGPRWEFITKSREYRPSGTRIASGPYAGQFPYIPKGMPGTYDTHSKNKRK